VDLVLHFLNALACFQGFGGTGIPGSRPGQALPVTAFRVKSPTDRRDACPTMASPKFAAEHMKAGTWCGIPPARLFRQRFSFKLTETLGRGRSETRPYKIYCVGKRLIQPST